MKVFNDRELSASFSLAHSAVHGGRRQGVLRAGTLLEPLIFVSGSSLLGHRLCIAVPANVPENIHSGKLLLHF